MNFQGKLAFAGGTSLRLVRPSDDNFLLDMFMFARPHLTYAHHDREFVRFLYEDQRRIDRLGAEARYPEHLEFVIERTGQDVGYLRLNFGYADWRIAEIAVHPLARGKGIGGVVLKGLQEVAGQAGMTLSLSTPATYGSAMGYYARHGFVVLPDPAPMPAMLHMAWYPPGRAPNAAAAARA
jgi:GNAT superfamily N-acetyltransferase